MMHSVLKKLSGIAYDVTVGLLQQYKRTTMDLAKIELATYYVKAVKLIRQECLISTLILFGVIIFASAIGVIQMAILLYAPWKVPGRIAAALFLGIACSVAPLLIVLRFFSQKRWMAITKADEFIARAMDGTSSDG